MMEVSELLLSLCHYPTVAKKKSSTFREHGVLGGVGEGGRVEAPVSTHQLNWVDAGHRQRFILLNRPGECWKPGPV